MVTEKTRMDTCGKGTEMSKHKSYADATQEGIKKVTDRYGWNSDITTRYMLGQIAVNLALVTDCLIEIYGSERRKEIDDERNKMRGD